jgi:hypothetical protein
LPFVLLEREADQLPMKKKKKNSVEQLLSAATIKKERGKSWSSPVARENT